MPRPWAEQTILERMAFAVERIKDRLARATAALEAAGVPYAVVGGNAVAAWVATIDPGGVRNTKDVDILLRRSDLAAAERALAVAGFIQYETAGVTMFLDGPNTGPRDAVHVLFANEKVRPHDAAETPGIDEIFNREDFKVISLEAIVRMKLTSFRLKDQVHLQDMLEVGLIDATWTARFSPELANRLQSIIDTPEN
jgi:hypothetical protein